MAKHKFENGINPLDEIKDKILKRDIPGARFLEIERIKVEEQVRKTFPKESIQELADSISEVGLISPLTVKKIDGDPDNFLLIAGERRLMALKLLGETKAQVIVREIAAEQVELVQLIENLHREDVPPLELAEGYKSLKDKYGLSLREIAKKIGKSHEHVNQMLQLLELPDYIKNDITLSSGLTPSKALEISKLDKKTQKEVLKNIDNFSREAIRKLQKNEPSETKNREPETGAFNGQERDADMAQNQEPENNPKPRIPGAPLYEQKTDSEDEDGFGETPNTEDEEPETIKAEEDTAEQKNPNPEGQNPDIDKLIEEFNSSAENIRIKNIGFQAVSIWSANPQTLIDIVYGLKKKYCK